MPTIDPGCLPPDERASPFGDGAAGAAALAAIRPEHPDLAAALATRWAELPAPVKQPDQMLGRRMTGCEGTQRTARAARLLRRLGGPRAICRDPQIRATQERLQACSYPMAHPDPGTLVPACSACRARLATCARRAAAAPTARFSPA